MFSICLKHFISNVWMLLTVAYDNVQDLHQYRAMDTMSAWSRLTVTESLISRLFYKFHNLVIFDIDIEIHNIVLTVLDA